MENSNLTPEELTKYQKHFSESDFWLKLRTLAKKAGVKVTYYALTLYYTLTDPNTPLDLVPDFLPFAGLADDWAALIAAVTYVTSAITPAIKARAREKTEEWFGPLADSQLDGLE